MNDPIEHVIQEIKNCRQFKTARQKRRLKPNFLNNVAEIFENHGFETTRIYLLDKRNKRDMKKQSEAVLTVLEMMRKCPSIHQHRAIGRQVIKTLNVI